MNLRTLLQERPDSTASESWCAQPARFAVRRQAHARHQTRIVVFMDAAPTPERRTSMKHRADLEEAGRILRWNAFIEGAMTLSPAAAGAAQQVMWPIRDAMAGEWPKAAQSEDGGLFVTWEDTPVYLELEIEPTGYIGWFVKDRRSGDHDAGPERGEPLQLQDIFNWLAEHRP